MANLIRIAAICHDYGFVVSRLNHEERSIVEIQPFLIPILTSDEVAIVNGMIRATKVPQEPKTFYEEILADADLDYLGRKDYNDISAKLFKEYLCRLRRKSDDKSIPYAWRFLWYGKNNG